MIDYHEGCEIMMTMTIDNCTGTVFYHQVLPLKVMIVDHEGCEIMMMMTNDNALGQFSLSGKLESYPLHHEGYFGTEPIQINDQKIVINYVDVARFYIWQCLLHKTVALRCN